MTKTMERLRAGKLPVLLALALLWGSAFMPVTAGDRIKVMVLGFRSTVMDDVQDAYLREALLRLMAQKGFAIVPVMDLEAIRTEGMADSLRYMTLSQIKESMKKYNAAYAVYGELEPDGKSGAGEIQQDKNYRCTISLYCIGNNTTTPLQHTIAGRENWHLFFQELASALADLVDRAINN